MALAARVLEGENRDDGWKLVVPRSLGAHCVGLAHRLHVGDAADQICRAGSRPCVAMSGFPWQSGRLPFSHSANGGDDGGVVSDHHHRGGVDDGGACRSILHQSC